MSRSLNHMDANSFAKTQKLPAKLPFSPLFAPDLDFS